MKAIQSQLAKKKVLIMGILNITPDSFSDGGKFNNSQSAIRQVKKMEEEGADIIDIGAQSTGPGSKNVKLEEEIERLIPLLAKIRKCTKLPISIDTYQSQVAQQALLIGADMINDVTALRGDKKMAQVIAKSKSPIILMYSKDKSARTTNIQKKYKDVIGTIKKFLKTRITYAKSQGIKDSQIILDPGMGAFISSIPAYSLEIIARLEELKELNKKLLVGISRKSFLGGSINDRDEKGPLLEYIAYLKGASIIRTHNIKTTKACLQWI